MVSKTLGCKFDGLLNLAKVRGLMIKAPGMMKRLSETVGNCHQYQTIRKGFGITSMVIADATNDIYNFPMIIGDKARAAPQTEVVEEFTGLKAGEYEILAAKDWYEPAPSHPQTRSILNPN